MFDRLTIRIFIIFSLTIAFFLFLIITIPNLDSRNLTYVSDKEKNTGLVLAANIENVIVKVPKNSFRWWMRFIVAMDNLKRPGQFLYILTPSEQIIAPDTSNIDIVRNFSELTSKSSSPAKKIYDNLEIIGPFLIPYSDESYHLYIVQEVFDTQSQFVNLIFDHPFLLLALTMIASTPLLLWLSWSLAKPARRLKKAADQVARGNIQEWPELEKFGSSEFKATGMSFNHMLRELKRMQELQQRLLSDISHELRTPLTRLQLAASLSRRKYGETKENERIEIESKKLDLMIGELLSLARQQYANNEIKAPHQFNRLLKNVLDNATFEAEQLGKSLNLSTNLPEKSILCYPQALCSAFENVIRNAFRYSHQQIDVSFKLSNEQLITTIDDDGPGVADHELQQIFRPFYRTSEARDRESGGSGLGLAIVANAITQDNGEVYAEKSHLGGLRIVIILPLYHKS
ncbi:envelope stress sensor histidine kinase CpxA [Orbus hercynius]|uniref:envelope stress sensor histidine kinase CpxA n=1 Tax=Orbus hercynius TaxID=593135 RepID=UPI000EABA9E6|nr:envelope stress sensor histidine kinase CpxA [Orbus hercynius]